MTVFAIVVTFIGASAVSIAAQTPTADHEQHHPGTPGAGIAANDPCAVEATPPAAMPASGMMGTPPMSGDMAGMMGQFDRMFIDMMIPHHASAVAIAEVALTRAERPEIRALAEEIIASQSGEIEQMQPWREEWFPGAPVMPMEEMMATMTGMMSEVMPSEMPGGMMGTPATMPGMGEMGMMMDMGQEMARLCATTEGFDLAFIDAMTPHHQSAIAMAQVALARADHPELRALAEEIIAAQQREIGQMQEWRAAWAGTATPAPSPTP
jgi:uncharacterized protein (DUF305 family)